MDECASLPCLHGTQCMDKVGSYECNCTGLGMFCLVVSLLRGFLVRPWFNVANDYEVTGASFLVLFRYYIYVSTNCRGIENLLTRLC